MVRLSRFDPYFPLPWTFFRFHTLHSSRCWRVFSDILLPPARLFRGFSGTLYMLFFLPPYYHFPVFFGQAETSITRVGFSLLFPDGCLLRNEPPYLLLFVFPTPFPVSATCVTSSLFPPFSSPQTPADLSLCPEVPLPSSVGLSRLSSSSSLLASF